jgi:transketolase
MLIVGPLAGGILNATMLLAEDRRPNLWVLTELPIIPESVPEEFLRQLRFSRCLWVVEEHVRHGGVGQMLVHALTVMGECPASFVHRCAAGYVSGLYGSQVFHRKENGLDPESITADLR